MIWIVRQQEHDAYTFQTFVSGRTTNECVSACIAVTERGAGANNPLFILGPTGSGKTHLLHAIADALRRGATCMNVVRVSADAFVTQMLERIRADEMRSFKDSLTGVHVLLLDDIHLLMGKERTLEEVCRVVGELTTNRVLVVVSSTVAEVFTHLLRWLPDSARHRVTTLGYPDASSRMEIVRRASERHHLALTKKSARAVGIKFRGSAPELESVVARIAAEFAACRPDPEC
jgi:chromosomal replication initiator protein